MLIYNILNADFQTTLTLDARFQRFSLSSNIPSNVVNPQNKIKISNVSVTYQAQLKLTIEQCTYFEAILIGEVSLKHLLLLDQIIRQ